MDPDELLGAVVDGATEFVPAPVFPEATAAQFVVSFGPTVGFDESSAKANALVERIKEIVTNAKRFIFFISFSSYLRLDKATVMPCVIKF